MTMATRYRLPNCLTGDEVRTYHRDIAEFSEDQLVAERSMVAAEFARQVATRSHEVVHVFEHPGFIVAVDWLKTRLRLLDAEISRRRRSR